MNYLNYKKWTINDTRSYKTDGNKKTNCWKHEIKTVTQKSQTIQQDLSDSQTAIRMVRASKGIYPGTVIRVMGVTKSIREQLGPSTILFRDGKLEILPFQHRNDDDVD